MTERSGRRGPAALLVAGIALGALGGIAGGVLTVAAPAQAQQVEDLRYRLQVLDAELADIRARLGGVGTVPGGAPAGVLSNSRVTELEGELRRLTATVEELQNQVRRIGEEAARRFSDIEFRLTELEGGDLGALQPVEPLGGTGSGSAPAPGPVEPAPAQTSASGTQPGQTLPPIPGTFPAGTGGVQPPGSGIATGPSGQGTFGGVEVPVSGQSGGQDVAAASAGERGDLDRAVQDVRQGRFDQAEERLRRFLNEYPGSPLKAEAWYWLGESQFVRGNHSEAARSFLNGYNIDRTGQRAPHNLYRLGVTLGRLGQVGEACMTLREVRNQFPGAADGVVEQADAESDALACG